MSHLKYLLIKSVKEDCSFTQLFPLNDDNEKKILEELLILSKYLITCGSGSFQHKNNIFYYRTYIGPSMAKNDKNDHKDDDDNNNIMYYENDINKKMLFVIFYCSLQYKSNYIDNLTNIIFSIFDKGAFNGEKLNEASLTKINSILRRYQKLSPELQTINKLQRFNSLETIIDDDENNNDKMIIDKQLMKEKKYKSRIFLSKEKYKILPLDERISSIKPNDTDLSTLFKQNDIEEFFTPQINQWKKIKIINIVINLIIVICSVILIIYFDFLSDN
jgi:hypothetical protein